MQRGRGFVRNVRRAGYEPPKPLRRPSVQLGNRVVWRSPSALEKSGAAPGAGQFGHSCRSDHDAEQDLEILASLPPSKGRLAQRWRKAKPYRLRLTAHCFVVHLVTVSGVTLHGQACRKPPGSGRGSSVHICGFLTAARPECMVPGTGMDGAGNRCCHRYRSPDWLPAGDMTQRAEDCDQRLAG